MREIFFVNELQLSEVRKKTFVLLEGTDKLAEQGVTVMIA